MTEKEKIEEVNLQGAANVAITSEPLKVLRQLGAVTAIDSAFYANRKPILYTKEVTPSQLFLAGLTTLSEKTVQGLVRYENGIIQIENETALSPFGVLVQMISQEARAELRTASAA